MTLIEKIEELIAEGKDLAPLGGFSFEGYNAEHQPDYLAWRLLAISLIQELGKSGKPLLKDLESDRNGAYFYQDSALRVLGVLKGALRIAQQQTRNIVTVSERRDDDRHNQSTNSVFLVHGHDQALLQQAARFIEKLGLRVVILSEESGRGDTIIEKLEDKSTTSFAVILLTPDDTGKAVGEKGPARPRARQNVILELGYFLGKLGRRSIAALYDERVELPSDYRGVDYIRLDSGGAWKLRLARELKESGLDVDLNRAI